MICSVPHGFGSQPAGRECVYTGPALAARPRRSSNIENAHRPVYAAAPGGVISSAPVTFFNLDATLSPGLDPRSREKIDVRRSQIGIFKSLGTSGGGSGAGERGMGGGQGTCG